MGNISLRVIFDCAGSYQTMAQNYSPQRKTAASNDAKYDQVIFSYLSLPLRKRRMPGIKDFLCQAFPIQRHSISLNKKRQLKQWQLISLSWK